MDRTRDTRGRRRRRVDALLALFLGTAVIWVVGLQATSSGPPVTEVAPSVAGSPATTPQSPETTEFETVGSSVPAVGEPPGRDLRLSQAEGELPNRATALDSGLPGIANLDQVLLEALRNATRDASEQGVSIHVTSGWRSPEYQHQLLREAVAEYGSEAEAARWVATADTSAHVSGDAVDIGPAEAQAWLSENGVDYGLCPIYANEPWHFEFRPKATEDGCPAVYPDPTHDPRMGD